MLPRSLLQRDEVWADAGPGGFPLAKSWNELGPHPFGGDQSNSATKDVIDSRSVAGGMAQNCELRDVAGLASDFLPTDDEAYAIGAFAQSLAPLPCGRR